MGDGAIRLVTVDETPRLYRELAEWWPLLSAPAEYAEEAEDYRRLLVEGSGGEAREVLDRRLDRRHCRRDEAWLADCTPA